jgi:hypothetical protein
MEFQENGMRLCKTKRTLHLIISHIFYVFVNFLLRNASLVFLRLSSGNVADKQLGRFIAPRTEYIKLPFRSVDKMKQEANIRQLNHLSEASS